MTIEGPKEPSDAKIRPLPDGEEPQQPAPNLNDEELQDKYRKAYLEQIKRLSCLGCGETEIF